MGVHTGVHVLQSPGLYSSIYWPYSGPSPSAIQMAASHGPAQVKFPIPRTHYQAPSVQSRPLIPGPASSGAQRGLAEMFTGQAGVRPGDSDLLLPQLRAPTAAFDFLGLQTPSPASRNVTD